MLNLLAQTNNDAAAGVLGAGFLVIELIVFVIAYAVMGFALMTIANKTGKSEKAIWGWIPILNIILMLEIADLPVWYIVLMFVPCVNLAVAVYVWWKIAEKRGKPGPVALAMLIPFVGFFVPLYIAFSD